MRRLRSLKKIRGFSVVFSVVAVVIAVVNAVVNQWKVAVVVPVVLRNGATVALHALMVLAIYARYAPMAGVVTVRHVHRVRVIVLLLSGSALVKWEESA